MIRLIVADIDGCFTGGGRSDLDLDLVAFVAQQNRESLRNPSVPHLVFNTGRPLPYVQAMQQAVASRMPSIAEFGAVLWCPDSQTHAIHPQYTTEDRRRYEELVLAAEEEFGRQGSGVLIEAGKVCQLTLYPRKGVSMEELLEETNPFVERFSPHYTVDVTTAVINFLPNGVHKGSALEWLSARTGIAMEEMAGIGDSDCDWRFLERCGISATPSNGRPMLQEHCTWRLNSGPADCIRELYQKITAWNG
ncbi:MAG: HAD hydrolase family protein [Candidatus Sumerlaeia bacterium]|nr:HAD hydrolase family protein [Candidatus Sumerlaeia bacterium]